MHKTSIYHKLTVLSRGVVVAEDSDIVGSQDPKIKYPHFEIENDLLWFTGNPGLKRLCIPMEAELINRIIFDHHDVAISGHPGVIKTEYAIQQNYFWKRMRKDIEYYIRTCQSCQRNKTLQSKPK